MSRNFVFTWFIIITTILACGSSDRASRSEPAQNQPVSQEEAVPQAYTIGQDVAVGDVRWKVLEAKDLGQELKSDNQFIDPKTTGGKFILVRVEVENRKTEAATYAGIELADSQDRTFDNYNEQSGFIPEAESCVLTQLNPNLTKVCAEIFELPADAVGLRAKVGDLEMFGGDEAEVELGF